MNRAALISILVLLFFTTGCCNALKHSKNIKIPPYVIEYYHYDDPEKPTRREKKSNGWYEHKWDNGFKMHFKIARVEESGVYFYRLLYRATNPLEEKVTLFNQNIVLVDTNTNLPVEQIKCWNWQKVSEPCNIAEINPKEEITKEIRFDYSVDEKYANALRIKMSDFSFETSEVNIDFYAKK